MPTYITQADLELYFLDLSQYGLTTVDATIDQAETDVINYFSYVWFPNAYKKYLGGNIDQSINTNNGTIPPIDLAYLNTDLLKRLMTYRTLGFHLFPSLMKTTTVEDDSFFARAEYFQKQYNEEITLLSGVPLYDFNKDSQFDNLDLNNALSGKKPKIKLVRS